MAQCCKNRFLWTAVLVCLLAPLARAEDKPDKTPPGPALDRPVPENVKDVKDLKAIQDQVKRVLAKVIPCTVGLRVGGASGSGVIIDKEGHILTAGHVSGAADRTVTVILPDGKTVKGKTLGANRGIDSGLIKITDKGEWSFVEMGKSTDLKRGDWCIATGHPGGYQPGRTPVVRLGRVQDANGLVVRTDCALVGGDSGGPLFDLQGRVIGIHSRISGPISANIHVPVDTYRDTWDRLVASEVWGGRIGAPAVNFPWMGVERDTESDSCKIARVIPGSPAEKAGIKPEDIILQFDGKKIATFDDLADEVLKRKIGNKIKVLVQRGMDSLTLEIILGKRDR